MSSDFQYYNHLGFYSKYYLKQNDGFVLKNFFSEILKEKESENILDTLSVISVLKKDYMLGDRTLVKGVNKSPWMAKPNQENNDWVYYTPSKHGYRKPTLDEIAEDLIQLLKKEVLLYINGKKTIGVLLTGGMDSRIIAGVLDTLVKEKTIDVNVIGLTWGNKNSRDVVYAERMAKKMGWDWQHIENNADVLRQNITEVAKRGCETSAINYHAMLKAREIEGLDCILAGSFGDSIGRAEYSGRTVMFLKEMRQDIKNNYGILKESVIENASNDINSTIENYWKKFPQEHRYQQIEQDHQIHYTRRMLNPCMSVINEKIPTYQIYTAPSVFEYIWSLDVSIRDNDIYKVLLARFSTNLADIPWARTGLIYDKTEGKPDNYEKDHHSYSSYFRNDLLDEIEKLVLSENIDRMQIFNMKTLSLLFKYIKSGIYRSDKKVEKMLLWLSSLSESIDMYKINQDGNIKHSSKDSLNAVKPINQNLITSVKNIYRSLK